MKFCRDEYVPLKRQGARVKIRTKLWLNQLRVAISTRASVPSGSSPQNLQTNFVDLHHITCNFKTRESYSKVQMIKDVHITQEFP
jgi:cAMP phosphodiesterase